MLRPNSTQPSQLTDDSSPPPKSANKPAAASSQTPGDFSIKSEDPSPSPSIGGPGRRGSGRVRGALPALWNTINRLSSPGGQMKTPRSQPGGSATSSGRYVRPPVRPSARPSVRPGTLSVCLAVGGSLGASPRLLSISTLQMTRSCPTYLYDNTPPHTKQLGRQLLPAQQPDGDARALRAQRAHSGGGR